MSMAALRLAEAAPAPEASLFIAGAAADAAFAVIVVVIVVDMNTRRHTFIDILPNAIIQVIDTIVDKRQTTTTNGKTN
jgi:hypothetical protein